LLAGNFDCVSALKPDTDKSVSEDLTAWSLRPPETRKAENPDKSRLSALLLASLPGFEPGASGLGVAIFVCSRVSSGVLQYPQMLDNPAFFRGAFFFSCCPVP
jgi:hypothetical protein